jgi:serine/threonine-protein kinase
LHHPHIVQVYDVGQQQGCPFFSLEYVEGGSLAQKLQGRPQDPEQAAQLMETLARAIHVAHQHGIVHRDLKPANVLLADGAVPKITDFGLAKRLDADIGQTQSGAVMGTPSYMAPEQAAGKVKEIGPATDVYALGAILYEMLTGRPPFQAATTLDTVRQVLSEEPVPPSRLQPGVPRNLEIICLKCLEKNPRQRYATAEQLADDLCCFRGGEPIMARPLGPVGRLARWARLRPALAATFLALGVFYANYLVFLRWDPDEPGGWLPGIYTAIMLVWAAGARLFQTLVTRPAWTVLAIYGWSALDVLMLTVLLLVGDGPKSALLVGYFLLIAGTALRFRLALVWFVTGLGMISYLVLILDALVRRSHLAPRPLAAVVFSLSLAVLGWVMHLLLRKMQSVTPSDW